MEIGLSTNTFSLWDYVQYKVNDYLNPLYKPNSAYSNAVLRPDTRPQSLKYWRALYNRFDPHLNSNENILDALLMKKHHTSSLQDQARLLEKKLSQLKLQLAQADVEDGEAASEDMVKLALTETPSRSQEALTCEQIDGDLSWISPEWKSSRRSCGCANRADLVSRKLNCPRCGEVFCEKCVEDGEYLEVAAGATGKFEFICRKCLQKPTTNVCE